MANKSNPASQTISLPQGGGALHGIGETFSPDLHTGTGNFTEIRLEMAEDQNLRSQYALPALINGKSPWPTGM
jgi:hypothetical protein